jgi:hypothetical protein
VTDPIRILTADPDDQVVAEYASFLPHAYRAIDRAISLAKALRLSVKSPYDGAILDTIPPGCTGCDTRYKLMRLHPGLPSGTPSS